MDKITTVKPEILALIGVIGSIAANLLGGWDMALQTLILFMAADYITGLVVAGVFKKSNKTKNGGLESKAGAKGLCRKGMALVIVLVGAQMDRLTGTDFIRNAVIIGYIANEGISIIENAGLMGLKVPAPLRNAIDILIKKSEE
ncbi:phage holin family protein [Parasporobacterium paucivorans]|uniref:Toxin secretion/phage lysis holin n=1 Tax=Parasporobacterium paucivorans DSM 15970 TaxID=1122934 RepID=A0A1M6B0S0_9FIRM|nr:phage holin family protein [Parasporobacterium paucivorans]SHI42316.1 toxin secretion/phage lysis holin [Parasporobacterium paucivorans DSM 15970]